MRFCSGVHINPRIIHDAVPAGQWRVLMWAHRNGIKFDRQRMCTQLRACARSKQPMFRWATHPEELLRMISPPDTYVSIGREIVVPTAGTLRGRRQSSRLAKRAKK